MNKTFPESTGDTSPGFAQGQRVTVCIGVFTKELLICSAACFFSTNLACSHDYMFSKLSSVVMYHACIIAR
jgi:hypothetical protein